MSKTRVVTVGICAGLCLILVDIAYGMGKLESDYNHKASPSADADPSPVEDDGEESDTDSEPNGDGE